MLIVTYRSSQNDVPLPRSNPWSPMAPPIRRIPDSFGKAGKPLPRDHRAGGKGEGEPTFADSKSKGVEYEVF